MCITNQHSSLLLYCRISTKLDIAIVTEVLLFIAAICYSYL